MKENKLWLKISIIVVVFAGIFIALRSLNIDFSNISEEKFKNWVDSLGVWGPLAYIVVYVLRPLILFPAAVLSATAGIIWGIAQGLLILLIAANLSAAAEFFFARYSGRVIVERYLGGRARALDNKIQKRGFWVVLLIRLVPNVAWDIQNLSLGLTSVRFFDYFLATFIGILPGSFALVFFGAAFIKVIYNPKNIWIIAVAVLIFVGVYYLKKYLVIKQNMDKKQE